MESSVVLDPIELEKETLSQPMLDALEQGLDCAQHAKFAEAILHFSHARANLAAHENPLTAILDTLLHHFQAYQQAQQTLMEASRLFAQVDREQQLSLSALSSAVKAVKTQPEWCNRAPSPLTSIRPGESYPSVAGSLPALTIACFGTFGVQRFGQEVELCQNRSGQALLRYLVAKAGHRETMDVLMELLWPNDEPEVARHKLVVASSALRRSLNNGFANQPGGGYLLCKNEIYQLNPAVTLQLDTAEFQNLYQAGRESKLAQLKASKYEAACQLYSGPFMREDLYADWSFIQREQFERHYLAMCLSLTEHYFENANYEEAAKWANALLQINRCDETAHLYLIRIFLRLGRRSEALAQYQRCKNVLWEELGVEPIPAIQNIIATK